MDQPYLATIERDGWTLDDGEVRNRQFPQRFEIPPEKLRYNLKPGAMVKLIFEIDPRIVFDNITGERMWVEVIDSQGDFYKGRLSNNPTVVGVLKFDDIIWFEPRHVIDIEDQARKKKRL